MPTARPISIRREWFIRSNFVIPVFLEHRAQKKMRFSATRGGRQHFTTAPADHRIGPEFEKFLGHGPAQASTATGHQNALSGE